MLRNRGAAGRAARRASQRSGQLRASVAKEAGRVRLPKHETAARFRFSIFSLTRGDDRDSSGLRGHRACTRKRDQPDRASSNSRETADFCLFNSDLRKATTKMLFYSTRAKRALRARLSSSTTSPNRQALMCESRRKGGRAWRQFLSSWRRRKPACSWAGEMARARYFVTAAPTSAWSRAPYQAVRPKRAQQPPRQLQRARSREGVAGRHDGAQHNRLQISS